MPVYETGHARNVQHFQEMISFVTSWGAAYQPGNPTITLVNLNAKLTAANTAMDDVVSALTTVKNRTNERETEYEDLSKIVTRVVNYMESLGVVQNKIDDLRTLKRKLDGQRAKKPEDDPNTPEDESQNSVSASQQSYTQQAEHFDGIIQLVSSEVLYSPTETAIEVTTLTSKLASMQGCNTNVITANTALSNKRADRDDVMYTDGLGLVDLALLVKKYTLAAFGSDSSEYDQIKSLEFTRPR